MLAARANAFVSDSRWQVIFMEMQTDTVEVLYQSGLHVVPRCCVSCMGTDKLQSWGFGFCSLLSINFIYRRHRNPWQKSVTKQHYQNLNAYRILIYDREKTVENLLVKCRGSVVKQANIEHGVTSGSGGHQNSGSSYTIERTGPEHFIHRRKSHVSLNFSLISAAASCNSVSVSSSNSVFRIAWRTVV